MMINPTDLVYFVEIAQTQNLSHAAVRLGISQPSLSLAIQRLEHNIGVPILIRSKRGVNLTPSGRELLAHSRSLLQHWEAVQGKAASAHSEVKGTFIIGAHPSVALYTFPQIIRDLLLNYPDLQISFYHDLSRKVLDEVVNLRADIGVVVNPVQHPDLVIKKLCVDEVCFWVSSKYKTETDVLVMDSALNQSQVLIAKAKKAKLEFKRHIKTSSLELAAELVNQGAGIGILPTRIANRLANGTLVKVKGTPMFKDEICLIYRVENKYVKAIQVISDLVQTALNIEKIS